MATRHFLSLLDTSPAELENIIARAIELKSMQKQRIDHAIFPQHVLGMIFEKSSTRTRVSFEAGFAQFGGHAMFLSPRDTQLGRGEPISDSAKVISSMVDIVMIRTFAHSTVEEFAQYSKVPVINALTDRFHPCQLLADMQTFVEHRGSIQGKRVAWVGDGNNMCHSYINAARQFDFELAIACPDNYQPEAELVNANSGRIQMTNDPRTAVSGADLVVTDTWASMGQEDEKKERMAAFEGYQVNDELMSLAHQDALFMHCLPAYRGMEIDHNTLDAPYSVVWDEAENRLHAQKALMEFLLQA
jgi:ornithine carbamoyltransferase